MHVFGYGMRENGGAMEPVQFDREPLSDGEVEIAISHCGVCHSDLHQVNNDWDNTLYPCVPGHEIVGVVTATGAGVSRVAVGDRVGVGCMVNSCQQCEPCKAGDEQYCAGPKSCTLTYNGPKIPDGANTYGGYSTGITVREEFVLRIPDAISSDEAAPILCAGVTTYNPMIHFGLQPGQTLGVAGIGGLGHMAVQIGKALGAKVIAFTTSPEKADAARDLGADDVVVMDDDEAIDRYAQGLDLMIDTIPYAHDLSPYLGLMKPNSTLVMVGNFIKVEAFVPGPMVFNRIAISGSLIGGVADTQAVLDLCAEHGVRPRIELIALEEIEAAFKRMKDEDVRFRQVIDMGQFAVKAEHLTDAPELPTPTRGPVVGRRH